ncbi:MAG: alpha/beta fold hydrolase [Betaproteobacteria bacterium]|nr:alpha/beta fold hydrolase [Betaproteobacteria bacterium]
MTTTARAGVLPCHVEGNGPPLILFHGGMGSWTHWARNIPALGSRFTVYAPDLPGCGDGPSVADDIAEDDYLAMVCEAVAEIADGAPADMAGFSFGGVIAAMVAARMPTCVQRLALLAPGGFGMAGGRKLDLRKMPEEPVSEARRQEVIRHNLMRLMLARPETADAATVEIQRTNVMRARWDTRRFSLAPHTRDALPRIAAPVMLLYGERDNLAWPSVQARIDVCRAHKPDIRAEIVPGAGHWVQYEAAREVNRLLNDFFG